MMKKFLALAAAALCLLACNGKDNPDTPGGGSKKTDVTGCWELSSVATKASIGNVSVSVYMSFGTDGNFELWQKIGEGRYSYFSGTYKLGADNSLSGSYSDGKTWGPYQASTADNKLTLTTSGGSEVDTYNKISSIPDAVTGNVY